MVIFDVGISGLKTESQLTKKFNALNKKYLSLNKKMNQAARNNQNTDSFEFELEKIQSEMSVIANELEKRF
jgi:hypothetical protein